MHSALSLHTFEPAQAHLTDDQTGFCYLLVHTKASRCVLVDPDEAYLEQICAYVRQHELCLSWILHTRLASCQMHSAAKLKSVHICAQSAIADSPNLPPDECRRFDRVLQPHETIPLGAISGRARDAQGAECGQSQYLFDRYLFSGDSLQPADFSGCCHVEMLPRQRLPH